MTWPDLVIAVGQFVLGAALVPTLLDGDAAVPRRTSGLTAVVLSTFVPSFWALGAPVSVAGTSVVAAMWWLVFGLRAP